ncbi:MAG: sigma-70 family RNA polymerase sigma factor [Phycisphaerales bacterium]|nr:MAG: sigma-70 family RNA polymerase sigma factor [Phycisphaerales bacterium]
MIEAGRQNAREVSKGANARESLTPEMLVRDHASAVLGLCIAHVKNFHDGEDIMQDVFLKAFTRIETLKDHTRTRQWLLKIARRMCIDHFRKRRAGRPIAEADAVQAQPDCGDERAMRVHAAVSKLPDGYREAISLYYLDGHDCAGVARSLGISNAAVRRRLVRARLMLHELLVEDKS